MILMCKNPGKSCSLEKSDFFSDFGPPLRFAGGRAAIRLPPFSLSLGSRVNLFLVSDMLVGIKIPNYGRSVCAHSRLPDTSFLEILSL